MGLRGGIAVDKSRCPRCLRPQQGQQERKQLCLRRDIALAIKLAAEDLDCLHADVQAQGDGDNVTAILPGGAPEGGGPYLLCVRPERLNLAQEDIDLRLRLDRVIYLGTDLQLLGQLPDGRKISVRLQNNSAARVPEPGQEVGLKVGQSTAKLVAA